jgi:hypothetical protein
LQSVRKLLYGKSTNQVKCYKQDPYELRKVLHAGTLKQKGLLQAETLRNMDRNFDPHLG